MYRCVAVQMVGITTMIQAVNHPSTPPYRTRWRADPYKTNERRTPVQDFGYTLLSPAGTTDCH